MYKPKPYQFIAISSHAKRHYRTYTFKLYGEPSLSLSALSYSDAMEALENFLHRQLHYHVSQAQRINTYELVN